MKHLIQIDCGIYLRERIIFTMGTLAHGMHFTSCWFHLSANDTSKSSSCHLSVTMNLWKTASLVVSSVIWPLMLASCAMVQYIYIITTIEGYKTVTVQSTNLQSAIIQPLSLFDQSKLISLWTQLLQNYNVLCNSITDADCYDNMGC